MEIREREIARLLITFGDKIFDEDHNISVAEQVLAALHEVIEEFDHQVYGQVVRDSFNLLQEGKTVTPAYFIGHANDHVRQLALDVIHSPYEYSENWEKKWDILLQSQKKTGGEFREGLRGCPPEIQISENQPND